MKYFARGYFVDTVYFEAADQLTIERLGIRGDEQLSGDGLEFGAVVVELWCAGERHDECGLRSSFQLYLQPSL